MMNTIIEMKNISKKYPLVQALDGVDFSLCQSEIHSLLGENGAGKSTLMKILFGMIQASNGDIFINDQKVSLASPKEAIKYGIGMVHQHFMLAEVLTVYENIIVGSEPRKGIFLDKGRAITEVQALIDKYNFKIQATELIKNLSVGEQQRVEILKALYRNASILILDEPTAVLTPQEVLELFNVLRQLKTVGVSIIIITHKLKETLAIADCISVLRDGKMIASRFPLENVTVNDLAKMMVGRDVQLKAVSNTKVTNDVLLEVSNISLLGTNLKTLDHISFNIHKNEILGIAGIEGNGQTELIEILTGIRKASSGNIKISKRELSGNPRSFVVNKVGHIPEDRSTRGLIAMMSIKDNLILGYHYKPEFYKNGLKQRKDINTFSEEAITDFNIKAGNADSLIASLSGGNQQKVVLARVFKQNPDVLIVAQPTRGVDVGAMEYIHGELLKLRDQGKSILLISADLDEVRTLSDRIIVIYNGKIVNESLKGELSDSELGLYMTGGDKQGDGTDEKI